MQSSHLQSSLEASTSCVFLSWGKRRRARWSPVCFGKRPLPLSRCRSDVCFGPAAICEEQAALPRLSPSLRPQLREPACLFLHTCVPSPWPTGLPETSFHSHIPPPFSLSFPPLLSDCFRLKLMKQGEETGRLRASRGRYGVTGYLGQVQLPAPHHLPKDCRAEFSCIVWKQGG